ncbi:hypothetical protein HXY32_00460 [Candidatus Bathyarchaeota archaeon]|nr:hypothetical protein [Candidatus Bathyarchaeota archaeon]
MKFQPDPLIKFIRRSKKTILLIVIVSIITLAVSTIASILLSTFHNIRFPSLGTIYVIGVEAYGGDINTTQDGKQYVDWGTVYPGTLTDRSFYLKSKSNRLVILNLTITNLSFKNSTGDNVTETPPIENPMNITWNYNNTLLHPSEEIYVTLTLKASSDSLFLEYLITYNVTSFSLDITITALEQY